jgi:hypothetical protein
MCLENYVENLIPAEQNRNIIRRRNLYSLAQIYDCIKAVYLVDGEHTALYWSTNER